MVNTAYRIRSRQVHPDKGGSAQQFIELQECKDLMLSFADPALMWSCRPQCSRCRNQTASFADCDRCNGEPRAPHTCGLANIKRSSVFFDALTNFLEKRCYRINLAHSGNSSPGSKNPDLAKRAVRNFRSEKAAAEKERARVEREAREQALRKEANLLQAAKRRKEAERQLEEMRRQEKRLRQEAKGQAPGTPPSQRGDYTPWSPPSEFPSPMRNGRSDGCPHRRSPWLGLFRSVRIEIAV